MKLRIVCIVLLIGSTAAIQAHANSMPIGGLKAPGIVTGFIGFKDSTSTGVWTRNLAGLNHSTYIGTGIYTQHLNVVTGDGIDGYLYSDSKKNKTTLPEAATLGLLGIGLVGVGGLARRKRDLKEIERDAQKPARLNPAGLYHNAQICLQGHVRSSDGRYERGEHCTKCGAACIDNCQYCGAPLRGQLANSSVRHYDLPFFCPAPECGIAYPWMQDRLETARELLDDTENLSLDERAEVWDLLKFAMSDPKSDWVQAKTKLIRTKLAKVSTASRDILLDFAAKVAAEVAKSQP